MQIVTTKEELKLIPRAGLVKLKCQSCGLVFERGIRLFRKFLRVGGKSGSFCSHACANKETGIWREVPCSNCGKPLRKSESIFKQKSRKSQRIFCNYSCSSTYNNTHRTYCCRRSKLELYLETQLKTLFPKLEIHYNQKDTINSELDIYIPSLKLAVELNGVFHYEPIFGEKRLGLIQNNDNRKFQACLEKGIELLIIDTSSQNYFKEQSARPFLDKILGIIKTKVQQ